MLLTQLDSGQERITHLISTSSTLWYSVTAEGKNLYLWFVDGVVWSIVEIGAGSGSTKIGESFPLVYMLAALLILATITLWMKITPKMFRYARHFIFDQAGKVS